MSIPALQVCLDSYRLIPDSRAALLMLTPKFKAQIGTGTVSGLGCWPKHRLSCLILQPERLTIVAVLIFFLLFLMGFYARLRHSSNVHTGY